MKPTSHFSRSGSIEREIKAAGTSLEKATHYDLFFSNMIFWSALVIIIIANVLISVILVPFLIVLNSWVLYTIIVVLAATIGFLYNFLINDIEHLGKRHHRLASIIIPLLALGNIIVMVLASNRFIADLKIRNDAHNPWLVGLVFVIAFIVPYLIDQLRQVHRKSHRAVVMR